MDFYIRCLWKPCLNLFLVHNNHLNLCVLVDKWQWLLCSRQGRYWQIAKQRYLVAWNAFFIKVLFHIVMMIIWLLSIFVYQNESLNTNISHQLFLLQNTTNSKGDFVLINWFETSILKFLVYKNKSESKIYE